MPPTKISKEIHRDKRRIREAGMTSRSHRLRDRVAAMAPLGLCVSDRVGPASLGRVVPVPYAGNFMLMGEKPSWGENAEDVAESAGEGEVPPPQ